MNIPSANPVASPAKAGDTTLPTTTPTPPAADASKPAFTPAKDAVRAPLQAAKGNDEVMSQPQQKQS